ncbi:MAG: hypothetical protein ACI9MB_002076 [Verrucomicrobiales bacterium]|jgi:hypothetical protein
MWNNERIVGTQLGWAGLPAILSLFFLVTLSLLGSIRAEDGNEPAAPQLRTALDLDGAVELTFFAQKGKVYSLEALGAEGVWKKIFAPVYGRNRRVTEFVNAADGYLEFRLDIGTLADLGDAPELVIGHRYSLNYGTQLIGLQFNSHTEGLAEGANAIDRPFTYNFEKTQPDHGQLVMNFGDGGATETLTMVFERGRIGIFSSELSRPGRRDLKRSGTFRAGADVTVAQPTSLVGSRFLFRDRGMTSVLTFTTNFSGSLSRQGGDTEVISYTYDVSSWPKALINVELTSAIETHAYQLSFTGRNSGVFVRRKVSGGRVTDTDRGKFSGKGRADPDDDGKGNSKPECPAPDSLAGRTLQARVGGNTVTILLNGAGSGSILKRLPNGRVALEPFTYSYTKESCSEGLLTITSPTGTGDEVQVLELDFNTEEGGSCIRKRYEDGTLDDSHEGSFSLSEDDDDLVNEEEGGHDDD